MCGTRGREGSQVLVITGFLVWQFQALAINGQTCLGSHPAITAMHSTADVCCEPAGCALIRAYLALTVMTVSVQGRRHADFTALRGNRLSLHMCLRMYSVLFHLTNIHPQRYPSSLAPTAKRSQHHACLWRQPPGLKTTRNNTSAATFTLTIPRSRARSRLYPVGSLVAPGSGAFAGTAIISICLHTCTSSMRTN